MLEVSEVRGRNGYTVSKMSRLSYFAWRLVNTIKCYWKRVARYDYQKHYNWEPTLTQATESDDGESSTIWFRCELTVVHADKHHSLPQQSRSFQSETRKVASRQIFSGLFRWKRRKSCGEVPAVEIQSSESSAFKPIPPVSHISTARHMQMPCRIHMLIKSEA